MNNKYYIYALLDPRKPGEYQYENLEFVFDYEPFYIRKGSGDRYRIHLQKNSYMNNSYNNYKNNNIIRIINDGFIGISIKIKENLSETDELKLEKIFIN